MGEYKSLANILVPVLLISLFTLSGAANATTSMDNSNETLALISTPSISASEPAYGPTEIYTSDYIINSPTTINNTEIELRNCHIIINSDDVHIYNSHLIPNHGGWETYIIYINPGFSNITIKNTVFEDDPDLMSGYPIVGGENLSDIEFHNNTMHPRWGVAREIAFQNSNSINIVNPVGFRQIKLHYSSNIRIVDAELLTLYLYDCSDAITHNVSTSRAQVLYSSEIELNNGEVSETFSIVSGTNIRLVNMTATGNSFYLYDSDNVEVINNTIDLNRQFFKAQNITNSKFSHNTFMNDVTKVEVINVTNSIFTDNIHHYSYAYSNGYSLIGNNLGLIFSDNTFEMSQAAIYQDPNSQNLVYNISITGNEFRSGIGINFNGNNNKISIINNNFNTTNEAITGEYFWAKIENNVLRSPNRVMSLYGEHNTIRFNSFYSLGEEEYWIEIDSDYLNFDSNIIHNANASIFTPLRLLGASNIATSNVIYSPRNEWIHTWTSTQLIGNIVHIRDTHAPDVSHSIGPSIEIHDISNQLIEIWDMNPGTIEIYIESILWKIFDLQQDYPGHAQVEFQFDDTLFELNNSYNLTIIAKDLYDNQYVDVIDLAITPDTTAPWLSLSYPSYTYGIFSDVEISYTAKDTSGNGTIEVYIDDVYYTTLDWNEPLYVNSIEFDIGLHTYRIVAIDRNGVQSSGRAAFRVNPDETEPYVSNPETNEDVWVIEVTYPSDIGIIEWKITDHSFGFYQIIIDDIVIEEGEWYGETIVSYTPSFTDKGEYVIVLVAGDVSGNVAGAGVGIIVEQDEPTPTQQTTIKSTIRPTSTDTFSTSVTRDSDLTEIGSEDTDDDDASLMMSPIVTLTILYMYLRINNRPKKKLMFENK